MKTATVAERTAVVAAALAEADKRHDAERIRIPWRTGEIFATVVELPVDKVVLNPKSHRIRAQLESSSKLDVVADDPYGDEAQSVIEDLLRDAQWFADLKANLKDAGQLEPGVVTADGVLVNANTRCVALRDARIGYIRAAVLPADASQKEIDRLELRLQMKRDFQSDYSFTNELLFIEDLVEQYDFKPEAIAIEMGWASPTDPKGLARKADQARSYLRMLALIRELQDMSKDKLRIVSFDTSFQALQELDDEVEKLKSSDYQAARELRDARLVGILSGAGYRELREVDATFLEEHLVPAMEDRPILRPFIEQLTTATPPTVPTTLPGLDLLSQLSPPAEAQRRSAGPLLEMLLGTIDQTSLGLSSSTVPDLDRNLFCSELRLAIIGAAEDSKTERDAGGLLNRPLELVRKAIKQTKAAFDALATVENNPDFEQDRLLAAVVELGAMQVRLHERLDGPES